MTNEDKVFQLHDDGLAAGKIAQKLKIKKAVVLDILGNEAKPKGFGDMIEAVTEATGVKKLVKWIAGDDCGCDERKFRLNKMFPKKPLCLNQYEHSELDMFFNNAKGKVNIVEQRKLLAIHNRIFQRNAKESSCASCVRGMVADLRRVYNEY